MSYEIGIRAHDLPIFDNTEKLAKELNKYALNNVQFSPKFSLKEQTNNGLNMSFGLAHHSEEILTNGHINIAILGCYINIIHPDMNERQKSLRLFKKYLALSKVFKCPLVATETGSVNNLFKPQESNWTKEALSLTIKQIKKLVKASENLGVLVGIEPGVNHPIHNISTIKKMLDEVDSPNLKIIFDPTNLVLNKNDSEIEIVEKGLAQFGDSIYAFHIKDYDFKGNQKIITPFGQGLAPMREIANVIQDYLPHSYVLMEETPHQDFDKSIYNFKKIFA